MLLWCGGGWCGVPLYYDFDCDYDYDDGYDHDHGRNYVLHLSNVGLRMYVS